MTNEQAIETFLRSDREVKANNITTHYNEHDDENLLRQYGTLIATRKGKKITFTGKKHSKTTTALTNSIKSLASKYGFVIEKSEEFAKGSNVGVVGDVKPIRQLGTGANVYFETNKYRVNDSRNGKVLLNVGNANNEVPLANIQFDTPNEAVFVAKKLQENAPEGLISDYHNVDKIIENFKEEYKQSLKETTKAGRANVEEYKGGGAVKYPSELKVGSVIEGVGFPMLKGIDGGKFYKVVEMDNYSVTFVVTDSEGKKTGSKKIRHKTSSIDGGIKTASRGDNNGITVIKYEQGANVKGGEVAIKGWYTKKYPTDDLGEELNDVTFNALWTAIHNGGDVYSVLGVADSVVRERVFEKLSEINGVDYNYVYDKWLGGDKYAKGSNIESENAEMVLNDNKQIKHHTEELPKAVKGKRVPAWVVAKVHESASDLSDATHYLDGSKYAKGGGVESKKSWLDGIEYLFS